MKTHPGWLLAIAALLLNACSRTEPPVAQAPAEPVITQLYAPEPTIATGETGKICY